MSYDFYKTLHLLGLACVCVSLGGIMLHAINGGSKATNSFRKGVMITHGVGLLLLLVAGFGMLAKLGIHGVPWWALGAFVGLAYKQNVARKLWIVVPLLVVVATVLARYKS
jgi:hypothetical protein